MSLRTRLRKALVLRPSSVYNRTLLRLKLAPENNYEMRQCVFSQKKVATLAALAKGVDFSPKGSVDAPLLRLIDHFNAHPDYFTTSSCSGRVSIFSCQRQTGPLGAVFKASAGAQDATVPSKSGEGGWLYVSHDPLPPDTLANMIFDKAQPADSTLYPLPPSGAVELRFEPVVLHIQARTLAAANALLTLGLQCGLRNSGLTPSSNALRHTKPPKEYKPKEKKKKTKQGADADAAVDADDAADAATAATEDRTAGVTATATSTTQDDATPEAKPQPATFQRPPPRQRGPSDDDGPWGVALRGTAQLAAPFAFNGALVVTEAFGPVADSEIAARFVANGDVINRLERAVARGLPLPKPEATVAVAAASGGAARGPGGKRASDVLRLRDADELSLEEALAAGLLGGGGPEKEWVEDPSEGAH